MEKSPYLWFVCWVSDSSSQLLLHPDRADVPGDGNRDVHRWWCTVAEASTWGVFVFCERCVTCCVSDPSDAGAGALLPERPVLLQAWEVKRKLNAEENNDQNGLDYCNQLKGSCVWILTPTSVPCASQMLMWAKPIQLYIMVKRPYCCYLCRNLIRERNEMTVFQTPSFCLL